MRRSTVVVVAAVVALAACGGGDGDAGAAAPTSGPGPAVSTVPTTTGPSTTAVPTTLPAAVAPPTSAPSPPAPSPPPPTAGDELVLFVTPSGNIGCGMDAAWVRCDLREADWELPPRPDGCELDHLHGAELGSEAFIGVCAGDTVLGGSEVVPYGSGIRRGPMACESAATGLTCRNEVTGAGFRLSRGAAERF